MTNSARKPRTRRTFPVTVTYRPPAPPRPLTPAERDDRIYNGRAWDATVSRAGGKG